MSLIFLIFIDIDEELVEGLHLSPLNDVHMLKSIPTYSGVKAF